MHGGHGKNVNAQKNNLYLTFVFPSSLTRKWREWMTEYANTGTKWDPLKYFTVFNLNKEIICLLCLKASYIQLS